MSLAGTTRRSPAFALETSETYLARAREQKLLAEATLLPRVRDRHLDVMERWLDFARRAMLAEKGQRA